MLQRMKYLTIVCLCVLLLGVYFPAQAGTPTPPPQEVPDPKGRGVSLIASPEIQKAALKMWTTEAMMAAQPEQMPMIKGEFLKETPVQDGLIPSFKPGGAPDPRADVTARRDFPAAWKALKQIEKTPASEAFPLDAAIMSPFGTPGRYVHYIGNYNFQFWNHFPFKAIGKLYFKDSGGISRYCTASVISGSNVIVTAAHCLYDTDTNTWNNSWSFVPGARITTGLFGTFPYSKASVLNDWTNASDSLAGRRYDIGVITLGNNTAGHTVTYYTGWMGYASNGAYDYTYHTFGYPSNMNNGNFTYICAAESYYYSTDIVAMGCNMMHGSSGGPWILGYGPYGTTPAPGGVNWVHAVVSGGIYGDPTWGNTFFGAHFSDYNIVPLCSFHGGC
jgi:V8-like Glu-specific endopeptidase